MLVTVHRFCQVEHQLVSDAHLVPDGGIVLRRFLVGFNGRLIPLMSHEHIAQLFGGGRSLNRSELWWLSACDARSRRCDVSVDGRLETEPENREVLTMAAINAKAGSERLSNLRIFPPQEGIGATNLHHRLIEIRAPICTASSSLVCGTDARRIKEHMSRNAGSVSRNCRKRGPSRMSTTVSPHLQLELAQRFRNVRHRTLGVV